MFNILEAHARQYCKNALLRKELNQRNDSNDHNDPRDPRDPFDGLCDYGYKTSLDDQKKVNVDSIVDDIFTIGSNVVKRLNSNIHSYKERNKQSSQTSFGNTNNDIGDIQKGDYLVYNNINHSNQLNTDAHSINTDALQSLNTKLDFLLNEIRSLRAEVREAKDIRTLYSLSHQNAQNQVKGKKRITKKPELDIFQIPVPDVTDVHSAYKHQVCLSMYV